MSNMAQFWQHNITKFIGENTWGETPIFVEECVSKVDHNPKNSILLKESMICDTLTFRKTLHSWSSVWKATLAKVSPLGK